MKTQVPDKFSGSQPMQVWINSISENGFSSFKTATDPEKQPEKTLSRNMLQSLKFLLYFGKVLGILPISGIFGAKTGESLTVTKRSISAILCLLVISLLILQFALTLYAFLLEPVESSPHAIAQSARALIFSGAGLFVTLFLFKNAEQLVDCICQWESTKTIFHHNDPYLALAVNLLTGLMMLSAIGENLVAHANVLVVNSNEVKEGLTSKSVIQDYWEVIHPEKVNVISYNPAIAVLLFITNKLTAYAWNYGDLLVSSCAIQLYRSFQLQNKSMHEYLEKLSEQTHDVSEKICLKLVEDHERQISVLKKFRDFLSPLVFTVVFTDIFFMALHVSYFFRETRHYDLRYEDFHVWRQVYFVWGFVHIVARVFITFISCGKVNKHVHGFVEVLDKCPASSFTKEVERTELKLRTGSFGLTGLNLFTITDSFILVSLNVVFTVEIVLLQSSIGAVVKH